MRIGFTTGSASVARTLESIIMAAGHSVAKTTEAPELILHDTIHPTEVTSHDCAHINLVQAGQVTETQLPCPLNPQTLIQKLTFWQQTKLTPLHHGWNLDMLARQLVHSEGATASLTEKECSLLRQLATSRGQKMGRDDLLEAVWGVGSEIDTHTLETHIYRLRSKLADLTPSPGDIITEDGAYKFVTKS